MVLAASSAKAVVLVDRRRFPLDNRMALGHQTLPGLGPALVCAGGSRGRPAGLAIGTIQIQPIAQSLAPQMRGQGGSPSVEPIEFGLLIEGETGSIHSELLKGLAGEKVTGARRSQSPSIIM